MWPGMIGSMTESFPRQQARTRGFRLGVPRAFQVSPDGERITFLRSKAGDDPVTCLWEADAATGEERLVADPRALGADEENLPPRNGPGGSGSGKPPRGSWPTPPTAPRRWPSSRSPARSTRCRSAAPPERRTAPARLVPAKTPALDPRPDPTGAKVAYVHDGALRVIDLNTGEDTVAAQEEGVTFGLAEFVAAEEMGRSRGYWWSPDGSKLLVARVDESRRGPLAHRRPRQPGQDAGGGRLPRRGHRQRGRVAACRHPPRGDTGRHRAYRADHGRRHSARERRGWPRWPAGTGTSSLTWSTPPGARTC